ncbi:MAG: sigma-70 family RNA polymerase sigma factor, partial [Candidatus Poribacteria bacterium]
MATLKSLIISAQAGDLDAFGAIVRQFQDMAVGYAYSILGDFHLAEDAAQEAFIGAYRDLRTLRSPDAFPAWLRKIIFKHADRFRRRRGVEMLPLEVAIEMPSDEKSPLETAEKHELTERVLVEIRGLPEKQRVATTLFYINGYSQNEIADFLEIPVATVKKRLQYSRKRLKERMIDMVQQTLQQNRPSKDEKFVNRVQLFNAVEAGLTEQAEALLNQDVALLNTQNQSGQTLLHCAAYRGHKAITERLINKGADVNAQDNEGRTPLHQVAIIWVSAEIGELLINAGADVSVQDRYGNTPLLLAYASSFHKLRGSGNSPNTFHRLLKESSAEMDDFTAALSSREQLQRLLQENPELANARRGPDEWTLLHYVVDLGELGLDEILLKHGADVNAQDAKGRTPLQLATHRLATEIGHFFGTAWDRVIRNLLDYSAGKDIFDLAALGRWEHIMQLFREDKTLRSAQNSGGNTALHIAAWSGQRDTVQYLTCLAGVPVNAKNNDGKTPIQLAAEDGHRSVAEILLRRDVACDIFTAATLGIVWKVKAQLQENPKLANATDDEGRSVLRCISARWRKEKCFWREWRYEPKE